MAQQRFTNVQFTVENPAPPPLAVASPEDLGPANGTLKESAIAISGGVPPYTVSAISGSIPGVTINSDGTLSGTATSPGTYALDFTITDSGS